jgi:hypothetical protein
MNIPDQPGEKDYYNDTSLGIIFGKLTSIDFVREHPAALSTASSLQPQKAEDPGRQ